MPSRFAVIFVLGLWLSLVGCGTIEGRLSRPTPPQPADGLMAGAGQTDLTPPPGFPMGGHSIEGQTARGFWTRLHARSVYLKAADGPPLVLTITDLWGMPAGLADRITEIVQHEHGLTQLGRESVVVAATHTHQGPANFASSRVFSRFVGPAGGFDPALFEFLAQRIAASVAAAYEARRPARLRLGTVEVDRVARNRSLVPFLENPEAPALLGETPSPDCQLAPLDLPTPPPADPCRAVDPVLRVLRIDSAAQPERTIAIVGVFAVHPTALPNATQVYSGDLFAVASDVAARSWPVQERPVVALFNGAEGDVSPNWSRQGRAAAVQLGTRLGQSLIAATRAAKPVEASSIRAAYGRPLVAGASVSTPGGAVVVVADRGLPGTATVGGAEDGRTRWHARGFIEGRVASRERLRGHGPKRPAVPAGLLKASIPRNHVPRNAPLAVYRVGPLVLVTLPGEFTTVMGLRVRQIVAQAAHAPLNHVVALGLAHAHLEYFATPQEYALQHYEGSSTFYGPHSGSFIAQASASLAEDPSLVRNTEYFYRPGRIRRFRPRARRWTVSDRNTLADLLLLSSAPSIEFSDAPPVWPPTDPAAPVTPRGSLEQWRQGSWHHAVTDDGPEFVSVAMGTHRGRWRWRTWWLGELGATETVRIRVVGVDGVSRCSRPLGAERPAEATAANCELSP